MSRTAALPTTREPRVMFRQYVVTGEWAESVEAQFALCHTDRMAKSVEYAAYSGDEPGDRYFTMIDGNMVEVTFRCAPEGEYTDSDDYMHSTWGVFVKGTEGDADEPIDTFHVRIDGRA